MKETAKCALCNNEVEIDIEKRRIKYKNGRMDDSVEIDVAICSVCGKELLSYSTKDANDKLIDSIIANVNCPHIEECSRKKRCHLMDKAVFPPVKACTGLLQICAIQRFMDDLVPAHPLLVTRSRESMVKNCKHCGNRLQFGYSKCICGEDIIWR